MNGVVPMFKPFVCERAIARVVEVLRSGWVGEGPCVKEFEQKLASLTGARYPVAVNSGTSALHLALVVAGVRPGDEVATTAQTMLATTQAIMASGATPVYADVQYETGNVAPDDLAQRITPKTRAILVVDWGGYPCDYDEIFEIGRRHDIPVIQDAAHALGASYKGRAAGSICPYTCFSFQAIKHLTTGDGGMLCVPGQDEHERAARLRWFGIDRLRRQPSVLGEPVWDVTELGYKYQMNDVAAAIGLGNLECWSQIIGRRRAIAAEYSRLLRSVPGLALFQRRDDRISADWLYSVHVERREEFCRAMQARHIEVSVVHLRIDRNTLCDGERSDLPELARFTADHVSLPLHPLLTDEDVGRVVTAVRAGW